MSWGSLTLGLIGIAAVSFAVAIYAAFDIARNEGAYKQNHPVKEDDKEVP